MTNQRCNQDKWKKSVTTKPKQKEGEAKISKSRRITGCTKSKGPPLAALKTKLGSSNFKHGVIKEKNGWNLIHKKFLKFQAAKKLRKKHPTWHRSVEMKHHPEVYQMIDTDHTNL